MTDKRIIDFPSLATPTGTEIVPVWATPGGVPATYGMTAAQIAALSKSIIPLQLCSALISTRYDSTNKRICGRIYFDPTAAQWKLSATSTATLRVVLETTNAGDAAYAELLQETGTGAPVVIATVNTTSLTPVALSVNVSSYFINTSSAGIYTLRTWINSANNTDYATCSGARIEILP